MFLSDFKGLRTRGATAVSPDLCPEGLRVRSTKVRGQEKRGPPAQAEGKFTLPCLFILFRASADWMMPTYISESDGLYESTKSNANFCYSFLQLPL